MTVIQKATPTEMIRLVHDAMFPYDAAHQHMNEAVRFIRAAEALGLIRLENGQARGNGTLESPDQCSGAL